MRARSRERRWFLAVAGIAGLAHVSLAGDARAQGAPNKGALERFEPSVPGDAFFGVPSPVTAGHLVPRAGVFVDYAYHPLSIKDGDARYLLVSDQLVLHAAASLSLWDRLTISADMPFALAQGGEAASVAGIAFDAPNGADLGDLRLGLRARLFGDFWDPFQIGVGGTVAVPTGPSGSYTGDGAVHGQPHLLVGGRLEHFVYSAALGATVRGSSRPASFDARAGAALVLGEAFFQVGPEIAVSAPFSKDVIAETKDVTIAVASPVSAEVSLGAKIRLLRSFVIGASAGPGLTQGYGTPVFFAVGQIGYEPLPDKPVADEPKASPPPDKPKDSPPPPEKKPEPADQDRDGIVDPEDACPAVPGVKSADPKKNGCPPDTDLDGIVDPEDACPTEKGASDPDPTKNGCPHVTVTPTEIVISRQVQFKFGRSSLDQTVDPVSDDLLTEVRDAIQKHPEIELIEVQGHADPIGPESFNETLSTSRAEAVRDWLVQRGIPGEKLRAKGYGSKVPVASNDTEEGRSRNRRVELRIVKKTP